MQLRPKLKTQVHAGKRPGTNPFFLQEVCASALSSPKEFDINVPQATNNVSLSLHV